MDILLARWTGLACALAALAGCGVIGPEASTRSRDRVTTFGANPQFDNERYEMVDLLTLIDPEGKRRNSAGASLRAMSLFGGGSLEAAAESEEERKVRQELVLAYDAFYSYDNRDPVRLAQRRNRVQDRLIGASNQRCSAYTVYLNRFDAYQQTGFGWATTLFGGAAAIVGGLKDARILGGLAGISSGFQAELAQGLLGNLASYVIVPGMELRRKEIMNEMNSRRTGDIGRYNLEAALADAGRYHGACTLVAGLEQAKDAIKTVENPGMRMMQVTLNNVLQARSMQNALAKQDTGATLNDEDLRVPSFIVDGQSVGALVGSGGVRYAGLTHEAAWPQAEPVKTAFDAGLDAIAKVDAAQFRLKNTSAGLEEGAKSKADLKEVLAALKTKLDADPATHLAKTLDATRAQAAANATANDKNSACLRQLDNALAIATEGEREKAERQRAVAGAVVATHYGTWLKQQSDVADAWARKMDAAVQAASFEALKEKQAAGINAEDLAKQLSAAAQPSVLKPLTAIGYWSDVGVPCK